MEMAESAALIRSESARRYVDGRMGRWGVVMLYPDRLASVNVRAELWGCLFGPVVMIAAGWPVTEDAGVFHAIIGVLLGSTIGRFIDRRRAATNNLRLYLASPRRSRPASMTPWNDTTPA